MKKILVFSAAIAALSLTSCNKEDSPAMQNNVQNEICAVNVAATKGYVTGNAFEDTPYDEIHNVASPSLTDRKMLMSAYLTPQDEKAEAADYFVGKEFAKGTSDVYWHADPKVYWPLGGTLDFLAISTNTPFDDRNVTWDKENASEEVVIYVSSDYTQDDILYSGTNSKKVGDTSAGNVTLEFEHAQAWLEFQLIASDTSIISIKDITVENIYKQGELTITRDGSSVDAKWSFRGEISKDAVMDDTFGVTAAGNFLGTHTQFMDILIPEQEQTSFVMHYTLAGQSTVLSYRFDLNDSSSTENWEMGSKYVYQISCTLNEITVTPSVTVFAAGNAANFHPTDLE